MSGRRLAELGATSMPVSEFLSVKKPVLPFDRFPGEDTLLGPEMKSTGEVMGRDRDFGHAFAKAYAGAGDALPESGTVLLSLRDEDKRGALLMARRLVDLGFRLLATRGTARFLDRNAVPCEMIFKVNEGEPNIVDRINRDGIQLIVNTPLGRASKYDERAIRAAAVAHGVPCVTTLAGALAALSGIEACRRGAPEIQPLQDDRSVDRSAVNPS
jgi:carbamoyl-phosphate synthase large subunit